MIIDLHNHAELSRHTSLTLPDYIAPARACGIGVGITEHNRLCERGGTINGVLVVPGIEVLCDYGDFLVFGAPEGCVGLRQDINALIGFVHGAGGIIIAAHPYCGYGVCRALGEDAALPILTQLDAIEAENGMTPAIANTRARAVADRLGKPVTGGSDAHAYHDMLKAATEFTAEISTAADVVTAIKAGRCRAVRLDGSFVS